jgi:hypothetical protein
MKSFFLSVLFFFLGNSAFASDVEISEPRELHDHEIAAKAWVSLKAPVSEKKFLSCVPRESIAYPQKQWPADWLAKIFEKGAMIDLMNCTVDRCAFNFLPDERKIYQELSEVEERQKKYIDFFNNRVKGKTGLDPTRTPFMIRQSEGAFDPCVSEDFDKLLRERPLSAREAPFRLSHIQYSPRMRQTTRLLQSSSFSLPAPREGYCYAEALLFADHYDQDRVEVWRYELRQKDQKPEIELLVRHRIDILNTWLRRLNKKNLREELKEAVARQVAEAQNCLEKP